MCSIFGIVTKVHPLTPTNILEAEHLKTELRHRGPDAEDMRQCSGTALLGSNRLRVTDAANIEADMPIHNEITGNTIVFNGEIYNFAEIKQQLVNHSFKTHADTEVILAAYEQWGPKCVDHFNGMFAFAIHDQAQDQIFLACDPTGQKSIYVYEDQDSVLFASEIAALISNPQRAKTFDTQSLSEYIAHRFIIGQQTHINEITKIEPGTMAQLNQQGISKTRYYNLPIGNQANQDVQQTTSKIRQAIEAGCKRSFKLEVPYALLLSGGIDSTAVLALAVQAQLKPSTYSIGFEQDTHLESQLTSVFNEFEYSDQLAKDYHTKHNKAVLSASEYCDYLDKWADYSGEPLGSQEAPCLVKLFESIQGQTKVAFSGSGPDEIFDGYSYGQQMLDAKVDLAQLGEAYAKQFTWCGDIDLDRLMPKVATYKNLADKYNAILDQYAGQVDDVLQAVQVLHFHGRLAAYEFRQIDTISMRHSIEARSPLTDLDVVQEAFNFSPHLKQMDGSEKGIYKQALRGVVPDNIIDRTKKGFPIPSEMWFSKDFEQRAQTLFDKDSMIAKLELVDMNYLQTLWDSPKPSDRNIFSRLYTLERTLLRQSVFVNKSAFASF